MANNQNWHHELYLISFKSALVTIMPTMDDFKSRYSGLC